MRTRRVIGFLAGLVLAAGAVERAVPEGERLSPVPVLMYHEVSAESPGRQFSMPVALFQQQMEFLASQGYHTILTPQYVDYLKKGKPLPPKPVMITFDDWTPGQFELARPILNRLRLRAVFFVPTEKARALSEAEKLRALAADGHEIGSHSVHHYYLTQTNCNARWKCCGKMRPCTLQEIRAEIFDSRVELQNILGRPPLAIAWPGNYFNDQTIALALAAGYEATYAVENQVMENGVLTNRVGVTTGPEKIYRTEIGGMCNMNFFPKAVATQRCCLSSSRSFHRHCLMMEP